MDPVFTPTISRINMDLPLLLRFDSRPQRSRGFTLVELLVVIAIIGILVGLLLPAVQMVREAARRTECQNNLRQVGLGVLNYESAHGEFPPGQQWTAVVGDSNRLDFGWMALILPFVEQGNIYDEIDFKQPYLYPVNHAAVDNVVPVYLCPSMSRQDSARIENKILDYGGVTGLNLGCTDYMGIAGPTSSEENFTTGEDYDHQQGVLIGVKNLRGADTMLKPPAVKFANITDGSSNTMMVTECTGRGTEKEDDDPNGAWISGKNITHIQGKINGKGAKRSWNDELIFSEHPAGANGLYADGSVHFKSASTRKKILMALCSRNGGEVINE